MGQGGMAQTSRRAASLPVEKASRASTAPAPARPSSTELDPQAMLVFAALARAGGVRSAAAALGVPRSTVSRRLAQLEESLGARLVVRTARRFALTELGTAF